MTTISAPRSPYHRPGALNTELYAWLFMRVSGVFLVVLVFGHLFVNLVAGEGISAIDFAFVSGKWANPFWQVWDQRAADGHQRLCRARPDPVLAEDAAFRGVGDDHPARHAGHLLLRPVPGR